MTDHVVDANKMVLSPAAQAVLDGFRAVPSLMDGPSIAAALRAAADQLRADPLDAIGGIHASQRQLLAIADELEVS
jgi:hypothetical protein